MNDVLSFAATQTQPPRPRAARIARPRLEAALPGASLPQDTPLVWVSLEESDDAPRGAGAAW